MTTKTESVMGWVVFISGLVGMIGATMAIFEISYGEKIALVGALWFTASFCVALLYVASKDSEEQEKKRKRR